MRRRYILLLLLAVGLLDGCAGARAKKAELRKRKEIEVKAQLHYSQGIDSYVNSRYAEAIKEWKKTLELQPDYPNALDYIERAQKKQESMKKIKAAR